MRGVKSHGMLLCASDKQTEGEEKVELLSPPEGTPTGERLCFGDFSAELPDPDGPNKIQKKKVGHTHTVITALLQLNFDFVSSIPSQKCAKECDPVTDV